MRFARKNNNLSGDDKKNRFPIIMGIIWGIIIACYILVTVFVYSPDEKYYKRAQSIVDDIAGEDYGMAYYHLLTQISNGMDVDNDTEYAEVMGIKHYLEDEMLYRVYSNNNMSKEAAFYENKRQQALEEMGRFNYFEDRLRKFID